MTHAEKQSGNYGQHLISESCNIQSVYDWSHDFVYSKMAYQIRMCGITYKAKYMYIHVEYVVLHMDLHAQLNRTCGISFIIIIQCT